jgi:hypothetical protein
MVGSFGGAAIIAMNLGINFYGYLLFFASSVAGIFLIKKSNVSSAMMVVTMYYAIINLVGIIRYW